MICLRGIFYGFDAGRIVILYMILVQKPQNN